jgi:hypothetical protein
LIYHNLKTKAGFWLAVEPFYLLDIDSSFNNIGSTILNLLEMPSYIISTPNVKSYAKINVSRYNTAKVKSEKEFMNGSKMIQINIKDKSIILTPTKNDGYEEDSKGFHDLTEDSIRMDFVKDSVEIAKNVLAAKEKCL